MQLALRLPVVVLLARNSLVADVAVGLLTLSTDKHVECAPLGVDVHALGAESAVLDVDAGVLRETQVLLDHLISDGEGKNCALVRVALRALLEVLLALSRGATVPAHPGEAARTLNVSAASGLLRDGRMALWVGAGFGAVLDKELTELQRILFVLKIDLLNIVGKSVLQVYSVFGTPLEGVLSLSAVETEQKFTVLAPADILCLLDVGDTFAARQRAPPNIVHLFNRSVQAVLLVFLDDALTEPQSLDVEVVQVFATTLLSALNLTYLARLHLRKNHTSDALSAKVVLAA